MKRKMVLGNWKMNAGLQANKNLLNALSGIATNVVVGVAVPYPYLSQVDTLLTESESIILLGAQDVSAHEKGAYTGEVSASMLVEFGVKFALVGHSERRTYHQETDALIVTKTQRLLSCGMMPVVCVGETLLERESGLTAKVVLAQLNAVLNAFDAKDFARIVVAYEPVWAIGTGKTATADEAQEVHALLREAIASRYDSELAQSTVILYGGSVKADNASALFAKQDIDGGLIGGAALVAQDFIEIIRAAEGVS